MKLHDERMWNEWKWNIQGEEEEEMWERWELSENGWLDITAKCMHKSFKNTQIGHKSTRSLGNLMLTWHTMSTSMGGKKRNENM